MCGLFGALGAATPAHLVDLAQRASTRGPHAHGFAWCDTQHPAPWCDVQRALGPVDRAALDTLRALRPRALVGHARLATTGATNHAALDEVQPLRCGDLFVAHNGRVEDHEALAARFNLAPATGNDSEVLGLLIAHLLRDRPKTPLRLVEAVTAAIRLASPTVPGALLVLDTRHPRIVAARFGQPLHVAHAPGATLFCSRSFDDAIELPDGHALVSDLACDGTLSETLRPIFPTNPTDTR